MRITVIGAGAWGTAMAMAACRQNGHDVGLHARDAAQADALRVQGQNARYLPGVDLPSHLHILSGPLTTLAAQAQPSDLFIVATPMSGLRGTLQALQNVPGPVAWLCKGFESGTGLMPHEVNKCATKLWQRHDSLASVSLLGCEQLREEKHLTPSTPKS